MIMTVDEINKFEQFIFEQKDYIESKVNTPQAKEIVGLTCLLMIKELNLRLELADRKLEEYRNSKKEDRNEYADTSKKGGI